MSDLGLEHIGTLGPRYRKRKLFRPAEHIDVALRGKTAIGAFQFEPIADADARRASIVLDDHAGQSVGDVHIDGETFRIRDLTEVPLILPGLPHSNRRLLDQAAIQHGVRLRLALEVDSVALTKALVMQGSGCSILTAAAVKDEVANGRLRSFPIERPPLTLMLAIATLRTAQTSRPAEALKRTLRGVIRDLVDRGIWKGGSEWGGSNR